MSAYSIGDLSRRTGVKVPTIRFYEERGLLSAPARTTGNQRRYDEDGLRRLSFIARARALGFTMEAIEQLLALDKTPDPPRAEVRSVAVEHLEEVRTRIGQLKNLERELVHLTDLCDGRGVGPCRILNALSGDGSIGRGIQHEG